ncbi:predicted protein [Uncinocarpus reesii 1704]|uniref:Uncharacterized protein n=1 Tax=Uncinocarpus reesii (strain UAMH 1704) TaxID=336963 RepID=C4JS17_UNCRE|nr:uncharacterized protein UREG_05256 [Uncinocarpus reesii 1704]EEP80414.1 predicted protein [Uncinocarpus reesii 1704]
MDPSRRYFCSFTRIFLSIYLRFHGRRIYRFAVEASIVLTSEFGTNSVTYYDNPCVLKSVALALRGTIQGDVVPPQREGNPGLGSAMNFPE